MSPAPERYQYARVSNDSDNSRGHAAGLQGKGRLVEVRFSRKSVWSPGPGRQRRRPREGFSRTMTCSPWYGPHDGPRVSARPGTKSPGRTTVHISLQSEH